MNSRKSKISSSEPRPKSSTLSLSESEFREKLNNDPDFINSKQFEYSLKSFLSQRPKAKEHQISRFLKMPKKEIAKLFKQSLKKLKAFLEE